MGQLKPDTTYIYEHADGITYAREFGALPETRFVVGATLDKRTSDGRPLHDHLMEDKLWGEIRRAAKTNKSIQYALDQCILVYKLSQEYENNHGNSKARYQT